MQKHFDSARSRRLIEALWDDAIIPTLTDYIRIPNKSPAFDPDWAAHSYMDDAVNLFENWARKYLPNLPRATLEVVRLPGRTPVIVIDVPGAIDETVLLYGHLDKQPEMEGWDEGFGPWVPRLKDDRLYGRGGADDGYAMFGAVSALLALSDQNVPHARALVLIEACEESNSYDLPFYVDHLADRIGKPSLVICLDSGCGNYDQLWLTTSLRGIVTGTLTVRVLTEGVHSGDASGVVPSSFLILRSLISRIKDETSGRVKLAELYAPIPDDRVTQARTAAEALGAEVYAKFPFAKGAGPVDSDLVELILNRTWRPQVATVGVAGLPLPQNGGNVLLPATSVKLSIRVPPTLDPNQAALILKTEFERNPPYGAQVRFESESVGAGWNAPPLTPWLADAIDRASRDAFGRPAALMGEGGSIPFMGMLGASFPDAQFVITGVLGPHSNAHGPNEFLHIPTGKKISAVVASVLADHGVRQ